MAGRKFCKTLCRLIEKKGKAPCVEKGCRGYICKIGSDEEEPCSEFTEFLDHYVFYQCTNNKNHKWKVTYNKLAQEPIFEKIAG